MITITLTADEAEELKNAINSEVYRLRAIITDWPDDDESETAPGIVRALRRIRRRLDRATRAAAHTNTTAT